MRMPFGMRKRNKHATVCVCVCENRQNHTKNPLPVFKAFGNSIKDTRFRIYICGLAGKNHFSAAAAKSSHGPAFMVPHGAQLKTISTIQTLSA